MAVLENPFLKVSANPFAAQEVATPEPVIGDSARYTLMSIDDVKNNIYGENRNIVDDTPNPNEVYARQSIKHFFRDQYIGYDDTPSSPVDIGRTIYNDDKMGAQQIHALLQRDIQNGTIGNRLANAEWTQYGFPEKVADKLTDLNNSVFVDNLRSAQVAMGEGLIKAVGGMAVGIESLILPKVAEDALGLDAQRRYVSDIDKYRQESIMRSFKDGDMPSFMLKSLVGMGGDMYGNLFVMKQGLRLASGLMGGNLTLVQRNKKWAEMAKNTTLKASVFANMTFLKTDGTLEDRMKSAMLTFAYMSTPALSSGFATNARAIVADVALNSGITALTGQYDNMVEGAKAEASEMGSPDDWQAIFASKLIQVAGPDVVFGAMTRSVRGLQRADARARTTESARLLKPYSDQSFGNFKTSMQKKYGDSWLKDMDDVDRMAYESRRASNAALEKGELPEQLKEVQKDFSPRISIPEAGRLEIEGDKKVWRDSNGVLRGVDGRVEQAVGDDKYRLPSDAKDIGEPVREVSEEALTKMEQDDFKERKTLEGKITKSVSQSVEARYAEAIQDLQDMINTDTSAKNAWRLEAQRNLLEKNPDIKLPKDVLEKLQQTNIQQISTTELRDIASEIERLTTQGKLSLKTRRAQEGREVTASVDAIKKTAKAPKDGAKIETGAKEMRKFAGLRYVFGTGAMRPWNLVDRLDGGKATYKGEAFKRLIEEPNDAYSSYLRMSDARLRGGESFIRDLNMSVKDLNVKHKIGDQKLTVDELLSVYASSKNRLMHNAVLHGNFKGDVALYKQAVDVIANDTKLKALGDYVVYDYATNYDRVRRANIKNENKILSQEENYVPMIRVGDDKAKTMEEISADLAGRAENVKKLPDNKFTIDRVDIPDSMQDPVKLGLYNQWEKSVNDQERYINMFESVKKMNAILADKELRTQIKGAYGEDYIKALDSYTQAYANPMSIYDTTSFSKYSRNMRKRTAAGFLAYNFVTMAKQVPSLALYMGQGGARNMLLSIDDFNASWRVVDGRLENDLIKFVEEKDPQVKHAHLERELQELKTTDRNTYDKIVGKLTDKGMIGIAALDKAVRTMGWNSVYLDSLQKGMSEADAVKRARSATMRTQPTASAKDLPDMYKQGEVANWFLMFSNQLNQLWNLGTYQLPKNIKNDPKAAIGVSVGLVANAITMYAINNHKLPETEDEITEMFMDTSLASIPLFGSSVVGATKGYDTGNPLLQSINKSTKKILSAKERGESVEDALPDLLRNLTPVHGVPFGPLRRIAEGEILGKGQRDKK